MGLCDITLFEVSPSIGHKFKLQYDAVKKGYRKLAELFLLKQWNLTQ